MPPTPKITPFADRLKKYGLTENDVHGDELRVGNKQTVYLGSTGKGPSLFTPKFISAAGVDEVKNWIGTPDAVLKKNAKLAEKHKLKTSLSDKIAPSFDKLHQAYLKEANAGKKKTLLDSVMTFVDENRKDISAVASAYIYGESAGYKAWRSLLDWHFRDFKIPVWLFRTVIVESGSVLEIGESLHKLMGNKLVIERGGTIIARNYLNIEFTTLARTA